MCGIIGYLGERNINEVILRGLERLEYRGYDSCGICVVCNGKLEYKKIEGRLHKLKEMLARDPLAGNIGIGHTRWATHGVPNEINAHPQFDCKKNIAVVHNGIIENYHTLRQWLSSRGHQFISDTDTEVIPHLIEEYYHGNFLAAVQHALPLLEGTYGLAIITTYEPNKIFVARRGSPLILGIGTGGEFIVASDATAIIDWTRKVTYLSDDEIVVIEKGNYFITNSKNETIIKDTEEVLMDLAEIEKGGYPHFMLKEIFEQPETITNTLRGRILKDNNQVRLGGLETEIIIDDKKIKAKDYLVNVDRIVISACGTSWHAGLVGEYLLESLARVPTEVEYASELRYRTMIKLPNMAVFVISQSGETADTLAVLRKAKEMGIPVFGIVNVVGSTIARETHAGIYLHCGSEIGVASTKAFTSQVAVLTLLSLFLAQRRNILHDTVRHEIVSALLRIPTQIELILRKKDEIKRIAEKYHTFNNFLYLGRGINFPVALEGALKLKEISYIHAEGYPAAEMKHGPIALIDKNMPVVVIATDTDDIIYEKVLNNIEEVKSRGGNTIIIATEGNTGICRLADEVIYVPKTKDILTPLLNVIPLQLLAYYIAVKRGCDVDKPRHLAKSVTVE
ncbi:MAG: glutamine--fructose-6-phosphate transaminase (isomerizing) [candidate division WOR-3 bacterium]|nr:glutamine--fructose-6-phosphate transaminase (isomerizing) [candidate division WOR-3 bacterium]MCX7757000.1 glutamine--fructose-6-phosphate transaminase (isomerizing) [candidate division WOR-3 bacterium]MDW7987837.1 glutamine--fructose-6-phosphate transaminase (isomerizing) [candidate division WOR-3 bacterium]